MQDKIQEIIGLVETYGEVRENYGANRTIDAYSDSAEYRSKIESKLRELVENSFSVQEPLTLEEINKIESASYVSSRAPEYITDSHGDEKTVWHKGSNFSFPLFARNIERAHDITKDS